MRATRITLLCHAATAATRTAAFPADEPIEASNLARLAGFAPRLTRAGRAMTSPALRARQTAEALGLDATVDTALRECDYGRWAGRALSDVQANEPEALAEWLRDPVAAPHGGEAVTDLLRRAAGWLDAQSVEVGRIVAVTHASVIRAAVVAAIGAPLETFWRIDVAPLSIAELSHVNGRWTLSTLGPLASAAGDAPVV